MIRHAIVIKKDHLKTCILFSNEGWKFHMYNVDMKFFLQGSVFKFQIMGTTEIKNSLRSLYEKKFWSKTKSSLQYNFFYLDANNKFYMDLENVDSHISVEFLIKEMLYQVGGIRALPR